MPNATVGGFRYVRNISGAQAPSISIEPVADNNTLAIFSGDVVNRAAGGYAYVTAAAGADILGVMDGAEAYWDGENMRKGRYLPAATTYSTNLTRTSLIRVISAIDAVFEVDAAAATIVTEANWITLIGENCDITATAGTTSNGQSKHCLDITSRAATAKQFRVLGFPGRVDAQDWAASRVKILVKVHQSHLAGAGV